LDLVVANAANVKVYLNQPTPSGGTWAGFAKTAAATQTVANVTSLAVGDLNADGLPDVAVGTTAGVVVLPNAGFSSAATPVWQGLGTALWTVGADAVTAVALGDLNGDRAPEIVVATASASGTSPPAVYPKIYVKSGTTTITWNASVLLYGAANSTASPAPTAPSTAV